MSFTDGRTIAAIATPAAAGGIGIIRISGQDAFEIADKVFRAKDCSPLSSAKGYTMKYGGVYESETLIDEALALVYRAPKSYSTVFYAVLSPAVHMLPHRVNSQNVHS